MSRRRHRTDPPSSDSSDADDPIRLSHSRSRSGPRTMTPHRYRPRDGSTGSNRGDLLQWGSFFRENPFGAGIAPILAFFGIPSGAVGGQQLPPGLAERMQFMRHESSTAEKQKLIDSTTIVCMHNGVDEVQCGICLQSLEQGAELRMAQYVPRGHMLSAMNFLTPFTCGATNFTTNALPNGSRCSPPPCLSRTPNTLTFRRILTAPSAASSCRKCWHQ
jgi:hypothetical protein